MPLPSNQKHVLRYMFPAAQPGAWTVQDHPTNGLEIREWDAGLAGGAQPTEAAVIAAAAEQGFADYFAAEQARPGKLANLSPAAVATLRGWSDTAAGTTVTAGNNTAITQGIVDNLAIFYDRFADLIEGMRIDKQG